MRRFLIDTDTASDDAVALIMALQNPDITVEAITLVAGNVPMEQGLQNALYTAELCKKQVPVYAGMARPILHPLETAQHIHGMDGLGDIGLPLVGKKAYAGPRCYYSGGHDQSLSRRNHACRARPINKSCVRFTF